MENQNQIVQSNNNTSINLFDATQFATAQRVAQMFAQSELVPDMYKAKNVQVDPNTGKTIPDTKAVANCMIALSMAMRIQADPLMVMQNMIIIYGRPSWSSKFLIATVNTCGRFEPLKFKFVNKGKVGKVDFTDYVWDDRARKKIAKAVTFDGTQIDNIECVAYTTAKGSSEVLESTPVDIKLAIQEGWFTKSGSKWQTMSRQMLTYRAASWWTSIYAPEISMGMKTVEEEQDIHIIEDAVAEEIHDTKPSGSGNANTGTINMDAAPDAGSAPDNKPAKDPEPKKADPQPEKKAEPKDDAPSWG